MSYRHLTCFFLKKILKNHSWAQWLTSVILGSQKAVIRRITIRGQPGQKSSGNPISTNKKLGVLAHACHLSYLVSINRRMVVQAGLGINMRSFPKNSENAGGMVQLVEHLSSKLKALSSIPSPPKKNYTDIQYRK
jgi:hypothetical protein